jgi:hypothetical protein
LRYQRYPINSPALVAWQDGRTFQGRALNVSQDGVALVVSPPVSVAKDVHLRFELPTKDPVIVMASTETVWSDEKGRAGLHFRHIPPATLPRFEQGMAELQRRTAPGFARYCV